MTSSGLAHFHSANSVSASPFAKLISLSLSFVSLMRNLPINQVHSKAQTEIQSTANSEVIHSPFTSEHQIDLWWVTVVIWRWIKIMIVSLQENKITSARSFMADVVSNIQQIQTNHSQGLHRAACLGWRCIYHVKQKTRKDNKMLPHLKETPLLLAVFHPKERGNNDLLSAVLVFKRQM